MLELLLSAGMALAPDSRVYADDVLVGFFAAANDRIVDGIAYADDGVASAGLLYGHPGGWFAGTELAAFKGNGEVLPPADFTSLDTVLGWRTVAAGGELSVTLQDYRLHGFHGDRQQGYQGMSLGYAARDISVEVGYDHQRVYYYPPYDAFFEHDVTWLSLGWTPHINDHPDNRLGIVLALGARSSSRTSRIGTYVTAGLQGRLGGADWQLAVFHTERSVLPAGAGGTHAMLRLAVPFRIL